MNKALVSKKGKALVKSFDVADPEHMKIPKIPLKVKKPLDNTRNKGLVKPLDIPKYPGIVKGDGKYKNPDNITLLNIVDNLNDSQFGEHKKSNAFSSVSGKSKNGESFVVNLNVLSAKEASI